MDKLTSILAKYKPVIDLYWPGPLTIILPKPENIPSIITSSHPTFAVRFPSSPIALALITEANLPIAAPSANKSGRPSPTSAAHVMQDLGSGEVSLILDGGECKSGVESTVLDYTNSKPIILRPGGVTLEMIQSCKGFEGVSCYVKDSDKLLEENPTTPGMKYTHYSPNAVVIVFEPSSVETSSMEIMVKMNQEIDTIRDTQPDCKIGIMRIGQQGDEKTNIVWFEMGDSPENRLFKGLRELESAGCEYILVQGMVLEHQGRAFMNRVVKAASKVIVV